jgi:photosystem II stability/assembly factor-like uncharacterized protein
MRRMLFALVVLLVASFASPAAAEQGSWQPRLSLYPGQFYSIAFASETTVWAAGPGGILLAEDGGASWNWTLNTSLRAVDAAGDGLHGWAVGPGGAIFATSDGGRTWARQQSGTDIDLGAVGAFDAQRAIAIGSRYQLPEPFPSNVVLHTEDGGLTWREGQLVGKYQIWSFAVLPGSSKTWLSALKCIPDENALDGCDSEYVLLVSSDGGKTWDEINSGQLLMSLQFASPSVGWAATSGALLRTSDGGKSWKVAREIPYTAYVAAISVFSDDAVVILLADVNGPSQQIAKTTDAGATWTDIGGPIRFTSRLSYFDEVHAVRVNLDQAVQSSNDGGATWQPAALPACAKLPLPFHFLDPMNGWVSATKLLRTHDGGASWEVISDLQFESIDFVSASEGWAAWTDCGTYTGPCQGVVMHSIDGGATWTEQIRHEGSSTPGVTFVDRLNGWVWLGADKPVLHTRDGGLTWSEQQPPGSHPVFVDASTVWAATEPALTGSSIVSLFVSRDGGDTWSAAGNVLSQGCGSYDRLLAVDAAHAWFLSSCQESHLFRTIDGGATWQEASSSNGHYEYLSFFSPTDGLAVRFDGQYQLLRTHDGGSTWVDEPVPASSDGLQGYLFTDPWHGWLMQSTGGIAQRGGPTELLKEVLYSYSTATPPSFVMPGTGEKHDSQTPTAAFAALGALGVLLVGFGGLARLRSRR